MKRECTIRQNWIKIQKEDDFATFSHSLEDKNTYHLIFSFPISAMIVDKLNNSEIIEVLEFESHGLIKFVRKPLFQKMLLIDLIIDILENKK